MRALIVIAALAGLAVPAVAQTQRLPRVSPAEQQARELNRATQNQNRSLNAQQQDQFEVNQLRQELNRQRIAPNLTGPRPGVICAPGQIGC
ncbi:MAG TPA: hypothetical protein VGU45_09775 [Microvirga sp.]|jgi:parvulin-like peptidyl-prolyl isomerase|nr:hypothetical protein [Microvirga sp.]